MTQDGDEPLLAELKQQDFQPEKFGSGHAETNNGNDSIILFESAVEKPIAVILPNTTIIKENSEETIETDQGVHTYDLFTLARKELLCPSNWGAQVSLKISSNE